MSNSSVIVTSFVKDQPIAAGTTQTWGNPGHPDNFIIGVVTSNSRTGGTLFIENGWRNDSASWSGPVFAVTNNGSEDTTFNILVLSGSDSENSGEPQLLTTKK